MHNESDAMENNPAILYEDETLLVLNKPAGLTVHGDGRTQEYTLADWLVTHYPNIAAVGEPWVTQQGETIARPGIVHRLDRDTSGVMVVAKTQEQFELLKTQFQEHTIEKEYRAFAYDIFKETEGEIDRPIGKSKNDFRLWSAQPGSRGMQREAHTAWEVLGTVTEKGKTYTYLTLKPTTGRTHQLRVHLKAIHHPILCDVLYAPKRPCALGFKRLALHAYTLSITSMKGEKQTFKAPLPEDFQAALSKLYVA